MNQQTQLYQRDPSRNIDKVYLVDVVAEGNEYVVIAHWGRRGGTLQSQRKSSQPSSLARAQAMAQKIVNEKTSGGYVRGGATNQIQTPASNPQAITTPQLLNAIDENQMIALLGNPLWGLQEKHDGTRCLIQKQGQNVKAYNRRGLETPLPEIVARKAAQISGDYLMDGELCGEIYHAFDLLERNGQELRRQGFGQRQAELRFLVSIGLAYITRVPLLLTNSEKTDAYRHIEAANGEGIVLKLLTGTYSSGRPNSGGVALKYKLVESAQVLVSSHNAQRSVGMKLVGGEQIGNVTIPPNHSLPPIDGIISVQYLYAYPGGALYQPVYLGQRDDLVAADCTSQQLKYKAA